MYLPGLGIWLVISIYSHEKGSFVVAFDNISDRKKAEADLRSAKKELEKRVEKRTSELEAKTVKLEEVNTALRVLLDARTEDREELEKTILSNVKMAVLPALENLGHTRLSGDQAACVEILGNSIRRLVSPYIKKLSQNLIHLTPMEIRIAEMIRSGMKTKEIAGLLTLSTSTILSHRESLRDKLGLKGKKLNLTAYLRTFE
jgi:DNA-binding CsgD family transcriptional regulator